mgnify:CR=1 FL=1
MPSPSLILNPEIIQIVIGAYGKLGRQNPKMAKNGDHLFPIFPINLQNWDREIEKIRS